MGKVRRIRVRGKQRKHPDAALVAEAIIQLGRELWAKDQARQQQLAAPTAEPENKRPGSEAQS
jgi:hypothetical protein